MKNSEVARTKWLPGIKNAFKILIFCWPCISIYLFININQLDALNFIISLFQAATCFEHLCSKHVEAWNKLIIKFSASSWLILINKPFKMLQKKWYMLRLTTNFEMRVNNLRLMSWITNFNKCRFGAWSQFLSLAACRLYGTWDCHKCIAEQSSLLRRYAFQSPVS